MPEFVDGNVRANCPECGGVVTSFEYTISGSGLGHVIRDKGHEFKGTSFQRIVYQLVRCAGCGRAGVAEVHCQDRYAGGSLGDFWPKAINAFPIPSHVPQGVRAEFKESELCASVGAWRAASSLLRSTLEKTLRANGYEKGSLADRIDQAATDGTITAARSKRAHEDIRVLGNDILHDEWKEVAEDEFDQAHHYAQRILEDFYDDRQSVEALLISKGRLKPP